MAGIVFVLLALALVSLGSSAVVPDDVCGKCDPEACPKEAVACPHGLVEDWCGCCGLGVCGLAEGEKCFSKSLALPKSARALGSCGDNLECLLRKDLAPKDEPEALCVCKEAQPACGSDNRTYDSVCQLKLEAARMGFVDSLYLKHWGPCVSMPWVSSGPEDVAGPLHQGLALDCEVKGYPTPNIHWEFKSDDGAFKMLPNDDPYVAVQMRGGPESFMATSWVQIVDLRHSDTGTYTCVASNSEGEARASAIVGVRG